MTDTHRDEFSEDAREPVVATTAGTPGTLRNHPMFTSRRTLLALAGALFVLLIFALLLLLWYLSPGEFVTRGGDAISGLRPVLVIDGPGRGQYPEFARPMGATFGPDGRIYSVDTGNNRVVAFSSTGRYLFEFGGFGIAKPLPGYEATWEEGLMNYPLGIDVDDNGDIYVADFRNDQIQVFDRDGEFLRRFPDPAQVVGRGASGQDGTGIAVTDLAVASGLVFAADTYQVVVYTTEGEFVRQFGRPGTGPGEFDHLTGIDAIDDGRVYVADANNARIQAFSFEGEYLWSVGGTREDGEATETVTSPSPFEFGLPRSIAVLGDGTIAVLDAFEFNIVLFTRDGRFIGRYGERGVAPGQLNFPNSVQALGDRLIVSDKENDRVQVLEVVR